MAEHETCVDADIAVVGAGVAGAACALLLAQSGHSVVLIERRAPAQLLGRLNADPRTLAISPGSQRLLASVGAWPVGVQLGVHAPQPYLHMCVWDGDGGGELRFSVDDLTPLPPALGHIVEQSTLTATMWAAALRAPNLRVVVGSAVIALPPRRRAQAPGLLQLEDGQRVRAPLIVAADGAASPLRKLAGGFVRRSDTGQIAIVSIVGHSEAHEDTAWQVFKATGPLALLPLLGADAAHTDSRPQHCSALIWSCDAAYGASLLQLDDTDFLAALRSAFGDRLGAFTAIDSRVQVSLAQQQAARYFLEPGLVLIGDAAHVVHPLAGQGVNLGLRDARLLTEVLARARGVPGALADARLLAQYELRSRAVNVAALGFMAGMQRLFASDHPLLRTLRSAGMSAVGRIGPLRRQLAREAMGQGLLAAV